MSTSVNEVINSHLANRKQGDLEKDIRKNISPEVVILSNHGRFHGHEGVRDSAAKLKELLPNGTYHYKEVLIDGDYAFLEWSGTSDDREVRDGADSFVVKDGKIVFQSIHYTVSNTQL